MVVTVAHVQMRRANEKHWENDIAHTAGQPYREKQDDEHPNEQRGGQLSMRVHQDVEG